MTFEKHGSIQFCFLRKTFCYKTKYTQQLCFNITFESLFDTPISMYLGCVLEGGIGRNRNGETGTEGKYNGLQLRA
jgi:hypothetical protein